MTTELIDDESFDETEEHVFDEETDEGESRGFFGRRSGGVGNKEDAPLTNSETIPLLPNANKKEAREAVAMKVIKLDNPGAGYKGEVHIGADEDYIANLYGDGIYTVEFINNKKKVIRKREGIKIAIGMNNDNPRDTGPDNKDHLSALRLAHISHNMERKRNSELGAQVTNTVRDLAKQHTDMVVESARAASVRDREFFGGQTQATQTFFTSILQQQQQQSQDARQQSDQAHRQQMEASERSHNQMLTMMEAMHLRSADQNNPMMLLSLFKQGMDMGRDIGGDNTEPWERAIKSGVDGLGQLANMQRIASQSEPRSQRTKQIDNPKLSSTRQPNPATVPAPNSSNDKIKAEFLALKAICDKRGVDFENIIKEAREYLEAATDQELDNKDNETEPNNKQPENSVD